MAVAQCSGSVFIAEFKAKVAGKKNRGFQSVAFLMKSSDIESAVFAFVDIETTGGNSERDRITEIGIKTLANGQETAWECLIDPQTFIPKNIQRLTGITPEMVAN